MSREFSVRVSPELACWIRQHGASPTRVLAGIEEAARFCGPGHMPDALDRVIRLGRHRRLDVLWVTQRLSEVSRTLTAMTDVFVIVGAVTEPRDLCAGGTLR